MNKVGNLQGKNILFLQGPMGYFFKNLDRIFRAKGARTYKIGFNAGDRFFAFRDNYTPFRAKRELWNGFILRFLKAKDIHKIFLFGDCRYYQSIAIIMAKELGIEVYVFEEGYVRPHYITMEKFGVNDYSQISRKAEVYYKLENTSVQSASHAKQSKFNMVLSSTVYYLLANIFHYRYPYYHHHRDFSAGKEFFYGVRAVFRKAVFSFTEKKYLKHIKEDISKNYFFIPLQTHNDFQILQHSGYRSLEKFIIEVLESFALYAPSETFLLFKHHPVDRGRKNYQDFILEQAEFLEIEHRILVVHDVYLPTCLQHAKGTITINSTVGLTSIGYDIPTITLGNAIYDIEGLTSKGISLDNFWTGYKKPDKILFEKFRNYLIKTTQLNGSFYGNFPLEFESDEMYL